MSDIDSGPAVGCLNCAPLLEELTQLRERCEILERLVRVDSALARRLSESIALNAQLRKYIANLENGR
jgi:hypothetical protein